MMSILKNTFQDFKFDAQHGCGCLIWLFIAFIVIMGILMIVSMFQMSNMRY